MEVKGLMYLALLDIDAERRSVIIVVISKANLDRMRNADPITLVSVMEGGKMPVPKYCQLSFVLAYEEDWEALEKIASKEDSLSREVLLYLGRGYKFQEDMGNGRVGWK